MGAAIGFALTQTTGVLIAVFLALGLGLALPYLLLTVWPPLLRALPKPGPWMERLKQVLAFPMYATAVWLVWVLAQQTGADAVAGALGGMVLIALGAWLYDSTRASAPGGRRAGAAFAALLACVVVGGGIVAAERLEAPAPAGRQAVGADGVLAAEPYSEARLAALRAENRPVFVNFTAAWCITCLVNERVALDDAAVADAFRRGRVAYLKGDWTNRDAAITAKLREFGRSGVPLYVFYPAGAGSEPVVLPQILTADVVLREIAARTAEAASTVN
jgi:thiol:disulfide interchange protein DsbD